MNETATDSHITAYTNGVLVYVALSILLVLIPVITLVTTADHTVLLSILLGGAFLLLIICEYHKHGHPLTAAGIALMGAVLLFAIRPISISANGTTTAGGILDEIQYLGIARHAGKFALTQVSVFFGFFAITYFVVNHQSPLSLITDHEPPPRNPRKSLARSRALLISSLLIGLGGIAVLIGSSGGLSTYLLGVSVRASFLSGKFYLTLSYIPLVCSLVLYLLLRRQLKYTEWDMLAVFSFGSLLLITFFSGGRGPLILGAILPILIVKQTGTRPYRLRTLSLLGVVVFSGAMLMSIALRENVYSNGQTMAEFKNHPVGFLMDRLSSGAETRPFDSLILLNIESLKGNLPTLLGETYARIPTWFIPGSLLPWKDSGANTWFTREYIPRFYFPDHVETSISAIGEGYVNFRYLGIIAAGILFGLFCRWIRKCGYQNTLKHGLLATVSSPLAFSIIRSDSYQSVSLTLLFVAVSLILTGLVTPAATERRYTKRRSNLAMPHQDPVPSSSIPRMR